MCPAQASYQTSSSSQEIPAEGGGSALANLLASASWRRVIPRMTWKKAGMPKEGLCGLLAHPHLKEPPLHA